MNEFARYKVLDATGSQFTRHTHEDTKESTRDIRPRHDYDLYMRRMVQEV